jgi:hypothetical protein
MHRQANASAACLFAAWHTKGWRWHRPLFMLRLLVQEMKYVWPTRIAGTVPGSFGSARQYCRLIHGRHLLLITVLNWNGLQSIAITVPRRADQAQHNWENC